MQQHGLLEPDISVPSTQRGLFSPNSVTEGVLLSALRLPLGLEHTIPSPYNFTSLLHQKCWVEMLPGKSEAGTAGFGSAGAPFQQAIPARMNSTIDVRTTADTV
jgi:hypothetical protein